MDFDPKQYLDQVEPKQADFDPSAYLQQVEQTPASVSAPVSASPASAPSTQNLDDQQQEFLSKPGEVSAPAPQGAIKGADIDALAPSVMEPYALDNSNINYDDPEVLKKQMEDPLLSLPKPQGKGAGAGVVRGLETAAEGLTSRTNIALMLSLGGAPAAIQKAAALGFGTMMAKDIPDKIEAANKATNAGDAAEAYTGALVDLLLVAATVGHAAGRPGESSPAAQKAKEVLRSKGATQEQVDVAFKRIKDADPNALRNASDQAIDALVKDPSLRKTLPYSEQDIEAEVARRAALPQKAPEVTQPVVKTFLRGQEVGSTPSATPTAEPAATLPTEAPQVPDVEKVAQPKNTGSSSLFQRAQREAQADKAVEPLKVAAEAAKQDAPAAAAAAEQSAEELKTKALETQPEPGTKIVGPAITDEQGNVLAQGEIGTNHGQLKAGEIAKGNVEAADASHSFVDDKGNVLNREQAWELAKKAGQIPKETLDAQARGEIGPELHSEHLSEGAKPKSQLTDRLSGLLDEHERNLADDKPAAPVPEPAPDTSAQETGSAPKTFAEEVEQAAANTRASGKGWFGPHKILINKAWEAWQKETGKTMPLEQFKRELLKSQRNLGIELSRADYPVGVDKGDLAASHTKYGDEDYHFITTDKEATPVEAKKTPSKEETIATLKGELEQAIKDKRTRDTGPLRKRIKALESAPKEAEPEVTPESKPEKPNEIWQKTREEAKAEGILAKHRLAVKAAVAEGKPVPLEVLEDFGGSPWAEKAIEKNYGGKASDSLLSKIEKALEDDPTKLFADPLLVQTVGKPVLRQAVKVIRASLEAGKLIGYAVEDAITYLKTQNPNVDEEKARTLFGNLVEQPETKGGEISEERNQKGNEEKGDEGLLTPPGEGEPVPSQSPEPETTAAYNAETDKVLERGGFAPIAKEASKELGASWKEALYSVKVAADKGQDIGANLVKELNKKPRALTDVESGVLLNELAVRKKAQALLQEQLEENAKSGDAAAQAETAAQLAVARDKTFETIQAAKIAGREWGRAGRFRQIHIDDDYNIVSMEAKVRSEVNNGEPLKEKQIKFVEASKEEIEKAKKYDEMMESARRDAETAAIADDLQKQVKEQAEQNEAKGKTFIDFIHDQAAKARARIIARRGSMFMAVEPITPIAARFVDETIIGASYIADKIVDFSRWSKKMVADFGPRISPHLPEIFKLASEKNDELSGEHETQNNPENTPEKTVEKIVAKQAGKTLNPQAVYELAKAHAQMGVGKKGGVEGMNELMKAVHKDLLPSREGLTEREVRDAFSGYGKVQHPSKEAVASQLREVRRLSQLQSGIEDALNKQAPKKSGMQRDKPTQAVREQMKALQTAMRDAGIETTSPEQQLASVNAARERSISNRIEDIKKEIATGEKPQKGKPVADSPKVTELKAERDKLQKQLDEINEAKNPKKTPEQVQNERYRTLIAKRLADLQARMDAKDFTKPVRNKLKLDKESEQAKADYERAKHKFDTEVEKQRRANLPKSQKFWNHFVAIGGRAGKLTSAAIFGKLGAAAVVNEFVLKPFVEEPIGGLVSKVFPKLADRAPIEGQFSLPAEIKAKRDFFTVGMDDAWRNLKMKKSNLDEIYGHSRNRDIPPSWYEYSAFLHAASKASTKRAGFSRAELKQMEWKARTGSTLTNPNDMIDVGQRAYVEANRHIYNQDNAVAKGFAAFERTQEMNDNKWLSLMSKFFVPIRKIPTNLVTASVDRAAGLPIALVKTALAYKRGIESLPLDQGDTIMRQFKKGIPGAALLLFGYYKYKNIGGFHKKEDQRSESDIQPGRFRIPTGGGSHFDAPALFSHTDAAMVMNIGATAGWTEHERTNKGPRGLARGAVAGGMGLVSELPFVPIVTSMAEAASTQNGWDFFIQNLVSSTVVPSLVPQIARIKDTPGSLPKNLFDPPNRRKIGDENFGVVDKLKEGIPGLRETLPLKKPKRRLKATR